MTSSQITSAIATLLVFLAGLDTKVDLLAALLPQRYADILRAVVIVAGVLVTAFSQSLNTNHGSLPVTEAAALANALPARRDFVGDDALAQKALARIKEMAAKKEKG